jgi:hypothetical protein
MRIPGLVERRQVRSGQQAADGPAAADVLSITDFYRILWNRTLRTLRESGDLPSEAVMPVTFVDVQKMYSTLAAHSRPPSYVLDLLAFSRPYRMLTEVLKLPAERAGRILAGGGDGYRRYLADRGLQHSGNGLLLQDNGMMDPAAFYPAQIAWPDLYLECSSCSGEFFVDKLRRAQRVRQFFHLPGSEVRIPDVEVPELMAYVLHPTGRALAHSEPDPKIAEMARNLVGSSAGPGADEGGGGLRPSEARRRIAEEIESLALAQKAAYRARMAASATEDFAEVPICVPPVIASVYRELFVDGIDAAISDLRSSGSIRTRPGRRVPAQAGGRDPTGPVPG